MQIFSFVKCKRIEPIVKLRTNIALLKQRDQLAPTNYTCKAQFFHSSTIYMYTPLDAATIESKFTFNRTTFTDLRAAQTLCIYAAHAARIDWAQMVLG